MSLLLMSPAFFPASSMLPKLSTQEACVNPRNAKGCCPKTFAVSAVHALVEKSCEDTELLAALNASMLELQTVNAICLARFSFILGALGSKTPKVYDRWISEIRPKNWGGPVPDSHSARPLNIDPCT